MLARISLSIPLRTASCRRYASSIQKHNKDIIDMLKFEVQEEMANSRPNRYRAKLLRNAVVTLSDLKFEIKDLNTIKDIDGLAKGVTRLIKDYLIENRPEIAAKRAFVLELEGIPGIGRKRAEKLVEAGCPGLAGLDQAKYWNMLSEGQQAGIRYSQHLEKMSTLEQANMVTEFIRSTLPSSYEVVAVGGCRRKISKMDTIEVMLFHPDHVAAAVPRRPQRGSHHPLPKYRSIATQAQSDSPLQDSIIPTLSDSGLIASRIGSALRYWNGLVLIPEKDQDGRWTTHQHRLEAIKKGSGEYRRFCLAMMPMKSKGAALIDYTGDAAFNKHIQHKADQLGLYLDQLGLWRWHPDNRDLDNEPSNEEDAPSAGFWQMLNSATEESIFEQLGMKYVPPHRRNLANLS